jgi:invasion protein IalB
MAFYTPKVARPQMIGRLSTVAIASSLGLMVLAGSATAQQPEASKNATPAPPAEPKRTFAAPLGQPQPQPQQTWVKVCEKTPAVTKGKDGKEERKDLEICLTNHERLDTSTGMTLVMAAIRQVAGGDTQDFIVIVPLGMRLQAGLHIAIYPTDLWERAQKDEKIDQTKLKGIKLDYTLCHPTGCVAEAETTPEFINDLKTSGGLVVFAINSAGAPISLPIPLDGFAPALAGSPMDNKKYSESRKALLQKIEQFQHDRSEQEKKQTQEQKGAPGQATPAPK